MNHIKWFRGFFFVFRSTDSLEQTKFPVCKYFYSDPSVLLEKKRRKMIVLLIGPDYTAYFSSDQWESKVLNSHSTSDSQDMSCCGWDFGWSIQCSQFSYGHTHTNTLTNAWKYPNKISDKHILQATFNFYLVFDGCRDDYRMNGYVT